jgi:uncharacterized protein (DUF697 family)
MESPETDNADKIAKILISVASRNASILGALTGAAVSTDEILGIVTVGECGVGIPANIAIAIAALTTESILLVKFQIQLVANIAKVYRIALDPDDPEDILIILSYALGGSLADLAGKAGMKLGGRTAGAAAKKIISKELLAAMKQIFAKIGVKILQRTIVKYTIPLASIGIGTGWNYVTTRSIGEIAIKHFKEGS